MLNITNAIKLVRKLNKCPHYLNYAKLQKWLIMQANYTKLHYYGQSQQVNFLGRFQIMKMLNINILIMQKN